MFLPLIDSANGLPKLKFVESTVFEITGGGGGGSPLPFIEGVGTKYLRTGRDKARKSYLTIFDTKHQETAKLGSQRITVKVPK